MSKGLRLAELVAGLSLATDLGMGQPLEQALRTCLIALSLGERAGVEQEQLAAIFYVALLRFLGCNADARRAPAPVDAIPAGRPGGPDGRLCGAPVRSPAAAPV